ncbi:pumilio domain member 6, partial [Cladochytrium tenue]
GGVGRGPSKATTSGRPARYGVAGSKRKAEVDDDDGSADDGDDWDSAESLSGEDDGGAGFTFDEDDGDEAVGENGSVVGDDEDFESSSDGGSDNGEKSGDSDGDSDGDHDDIDGPDSKPAKKERTEEEKRKVRQEQKKLLQERRASKPNASIVVRAKQIWEKLRMKSTPVNERSQLMTEMMEVLTGKVHEVTFKHDMARTIQCALKYGNLKQREAIAGELKGSYVSLASSQYGRFITSRILNYCPSHRPLVIDELKGHLRRLLFHAHAGPVIEEAWSRFANGAQRASLLEEFYGPQFALFRLGGSPSKAASLAGMLAAEPEKRAATLDALRATLESLLSKPSTPLASSSLLHRVLLDYLSQAAPAHAAGLVSGHLRDKLPLLLHTRDGARAAQMALLLSGPKDRRHALRSFRGLVGRIACEPFGHAVLLTACEAVDDTVAVAKYVFTELIKGPPPPTEAAGAAGASEDGPSDLLAALADNSGADGRPTLTPAQLLRDPHASRVVLFLLAGRNTRYQVGHVLAELQADDVLRAQTSKKDDDVRRKELRTAVAPQLLELAIANVEELIRTQWGGRVL